MKTFRLALPVLASALLLTAVGGTAQTKPALADYFTEILPTVTSAPTNEVLIVVGG
jgi:hypothetical protein